MIKKYKSQLIGLLIFIVILIIILPKIFSSAGENTAGKNPMAMNTEIPVTGHIVIYEKLGNVVYTTGTILANEEVELRSEISGKITEILFREGAFVNKGDLLIKINDADLQAQLRKAESKVKLIEDRETRQRQLAQNQMISQEDYESTLNDWKLAKQNMI